MADVETILGPHINIGFMPVRRESGIVTVGPDRGEVPDVYGQTGNHPQTALKDLNPDEIIRSARLAFRIKKANRWMATHPGWDPKFADSKFEARRRKETSAIRDGLDTLQAMGQPITDDLLRPGIPQPDNNLKRNNTIGTTRVTVEQITGEGDPRVRITAYVLESELQKGGFPTERRAQKQLPDGSIEHEVVRFENVDIYTGNAPRLEAKDARPVETDQKVATYESAQLVRPIFIKADPETAMAFAKAHLRGFDSKGRKTQYLNMQLIAAGASISAGPKAWEQSVHFPAALVEYIPNFSSKLRRDLGIKTERWVSPFNQQNEVRITASGDSRTVTGLFDSFSIVPEANVFLHRDGTVQRPGVPPSRLALVA